MKSPESDTQPSVEQAQGYAYAVAREYWTTLRRNHSINWRVREFRSGVQNLPSCSQSEASKLGKHLASLPPPDAGFSISQIYASRLPRSYRLRHGIYYTPIGIANKMLADAKKHGINFSKASAIDTSSGGASFLAPLSRLMFRKDLKSQTEAVRDVTSRLCGLELDPFGAWLSQFLIDCELVRLAPKSERPPKVVVRGNALESAKEKYGSFDYVVGNPPYGRVGDSSGVGLSFSDIVTGRPNLYQLFLKLAFLFAKHRGVIHQITPTGFIGGDYSRGLRNWITSEGSPLQFDFLEKRTGVFDSVQQELVISMFRRGGRKRIVDCNLIKLHGSEIEEHSLPPTQFLRGDQWVLPRHPSDAYVAPIFDREATTLSTIGFNVRTGYVVPYRHSENISEEKLKASYPLVWAESVDQQGFRPELPYTLGKPRWMNHTKSNPEPIRKPCVLVKRTSSKEQSQRIQAVAVTQPFLQKFGGFYAENHLNVIIPDDSAAVDVGSLARLLQTEVVNSLFRCINGTVTVSATELLRLPMPSLDHLRSFARATARTRSDRLILDNEARRAYGLTDG